MPLPPVLKKGKRQQNTYSTVPVILGDLYSPIISWDFLFSSSPVSAHDDVSGSKVVSRGCVVTFWTSNGADKVDFCHLKSP